MKRVIAALALALFTSAAAQANPNHYSAIDGPVVAGFQTFADGEVQFTFSYTGALFQCLAPHYEGTPVKAVFTFGVGQGKFPYTVALGRSCTTPWSYMLPTEASLGFTAPFRSDNDELWSLLRKQIFDFHADVEVAFQDDRGRWDSRYGQNYRLSFKPHSGR